MGKTVKVVLAMVALVCVVVGVYYTMSNRTLSEEDVEVTAVKEVILRNLDNNYPPTPKEVVKYYSDITKCLHNDTYTEEEFTQMADKMLALYDDELLAQNDRDTYLVTLKNDVEDFRTAGYSILSYTISNSTDVEYSKIDDREYAKLYCNYSVRTGTKYSTSQEVYELRKDTETGHWKILGFKIADE